MAAQHTREGDFATRYKFNGKELVLGKVCYDIKGEVIFVKNKAKIFSIAVATVKIFNAVIGKKSKSWYVDNTFYATLTEATGFYYYGARYYAQV